MYIMLTFEQDRRLPGLLPSFDTRLNYRTFQIVWISDDGFRFSCGILLRNHARNLTSAPARTGFKLIMSAGIIARGGRCGLLPQARPRPRLCLTRNANALAAVLLTTYAIRFVFPSGYALGFRNFRLPIFPRLCCELFTIMFGCSCRFQAWLKSDPSLAPKIRPSYLGVDAFLESPP